MSASSSASRRRTSVFDKDRLLAQLAQLVFGAEAKHQLQHAARMKHIALCVVRDAARWQQSLVFVHSLEDALPTALFFMKELLANGNCTGCFRAVLGRSMSSWAR